MTGTTMLNTSNYLAYYGFKSGQFSTKEAIVSDAEFEDSNNFLSIEGSKNAIDTSEEFITATYFSPVQIQNISYVKNIEAELPHNDPTAAGLKLGAMWYQKYVELKFTDPANTQQLANYELAIKTISERTGVSRAQIVDFFNKGIAGEVAEVVDREFNTISFVMRGGDKTYTSVLSRSANNNYMLSYEGYFNGINSTKELTAASMDELLAAMAKSPDFNKACIAVVKEKAAFIPGDVYAKWDKTFETKPEAMARWTELITNFYLNPTQENYKLMQVIYSKNSADISEKPWKGPVVDCFINTLTALSPALAKKFDSDLLSFNTLAYAKQTVDPKYNPLFATVGVGGF